MDRFRLKNIIILILFLVNVFLLVSLAQRRSAERDASRRTAEQLVALFAGDGMTLEPNAISGDVPPDGVSLSWDAALEERAAAFLLGKVLTSSDQGGGIHYYAGAAGEALFRSSGGFEASGTLAEGDEAENFCRDFCRAFSCDPPDIRLDETGGGVFSASALYGRLPVFNCSVTFTIENGVLTSVSGTLLPEAGTSAAAAEAPLSAAGALVAFQRMRKESVAVVSTVTDARLCYELQNTGAAMFLAPVWRIVTDTEDYYVNCYTGAVSAGGARTGESAA